MSEELPNPLDLIDLEQVDKLLHEGPTFGGVKIPVSLGAAVAALFVAKKANEELAEHLEEVRHDTKGVKRRLKHLRKHAKQKSKSLKDKPIGSAASLTDVMENMDSGKLIRGELYLHVSLLEQSPELVREEVVAAAKRAKKAKGHIQWNVAKISPRKGTISLLYYPTFMTEAVPKLRSAYTVKKETGRVSFKNYEGSANVPVMHKKHQLLPVDHHRYPQFTALNRDLERAGLLKGRIAYSEAWEKRLAKMKYHINGNELVDSKLGAKSRTLAMRGKMSIALRYSVERGFCQGPALFWHCGRGEDVKACDRLGIKARGWDPVHCKRKPRMSRFQYAQLNYVIDRLEEEYDRQDAVHTLKRKVVAGGIIVLTVRTHVDVEAEARRGGWEPVLDPPFGEPKDQILLGYQTKKETFRKGYKQEELMDFARNAGLDVVDIHQQYGSYILVTRVKG